MKRYLLLLTIFILGFTTNDVQSEFISLLWNNVSQQPGSNIYPYAFDGAIYKIENNGLPYYSKIYDVSGSTSAYQFEIENPQFELLDDSTNVSLFSEIGGNIEIKTEVLKSRELKKAELTVFPFKKVGDKVYRLSSFNLKKIPISLKSEKNASTIDWETESVLNDGDWVKIKTTGKGVYKISYSTLSKWGFSDPSSVNVFGSGGAQLSETPDEITYDDLEQCAVWYDENDGEDCLFFYDPGTISWEADDDQEYFEHTNSNYSNYGYFFLTEDVGSSKTAEEQDEVQDVATYQLTDFNAYDLYEKDLNSLISSGRNWYGKEFSTGNSQTFDFELNDFGSSSQVYITVKAAARSYQTSRMYVYGNSSGLGSLVFTSVDTDDDTAVYASDKSGSYTSSPEDNDLEIGLTYSGSNTTAKAWLDYIEINYRAKLALDEGVLFFRDLSTVGEGNVVDFQIESSSSALRVFDVTEVNDVTEIPVEYSDDIASIKRPADELHEYVAFEPSGTFDEPELVGDVENQNLHGLSTPEFLIISNPTFLDEANELADFHENNDDLATTVVSSAKVYNEFSSGQFSATAIRNFIKMFYDRGNTLKYVLLLGDGSFDNKNINGDDLNFIPTFQSENSLNPVGSFVTDDYYVLLDEGETVSSGAVDLGIGRIPASTTTQAKTVLNKIENYYSSAALGSWRNVLCFIADDEDSNLHMEQTETLTDIVNENHPEYVTNKIYLDAYTQETTTAGEEYPEVNDAIAEQIDEGVLVMNYVGHANEKYLADEEILTISEINSFSNFDKLPIFVTATCEFSRFDSDETSAGEYVLFNASGGGVGLFSTTRLVISQANFELSKSFYRRLFERDDDGEYYRMGDIMRLAKINTSSSTNKRNFSLLADPAIKLAYPEYDVVTSTVNGEDATSTSDTVSALQKVTISGYIADSDGDKQTDFSGEIIPVVYDKEVEMETMGNAGETPMEYAVQDNVLYKGNASVTNGEFSFSFVVPKDIAYNFGNGKIIYYANNGNTDAHGAFQELVIGGTDSEVSDSEGPEIQIYMDSEDFVSGDKTSTNPTLIAYISDESGINTTGTGIGHDITAVLDDDYSNVYVLNDYYESEIDDYTSGSLEYQFSDLEAGSHTLTLKAWDVANNSAEAEIEFVVSDELKITNVYTYPNPMDDYTYFVFEHNQAGASFDVLVEIFDILGRRIDYFTSSEVGSDELESNPIYWGLEDQNVFLSGGIYIYQITIQNEDGVRASKSGKFVIL